MREGAGLSEREAAVPQLGAGSFPAGVGHTLAEPGAVGPIAPQIGAIASGHDVRVA